MTVAMERRGRWSGTRLTILGLLIATAALVAVALVDPDGAGLALFAGALLLTTAGLVWRSGLAAHVWAAVLGAWLVLSSSLSFLADTLWFEDTGAAARVEVVVVDVVAVIGGVITLFGAVRYLRARGQSLTAISPLGSSRGEVGDSGAAAPWGILHVLAAVAVAVQLVLLSRSFFMGLGWGGFWYLVNLGQAAAVVALAVAWFREHPRRVLALPAASFVLTQVLLAIDPSLKTTECTPAELAVAAEFPPPPGSAAPHFESEPDNGCIARFNADLRGDQLLEHYEQAAEAAGWKVDDPGSVQLETGEVVPAESIDIHSRSHSMSNDTMTLELNFDREGEGTAATSRLWVVLSIRERIR